MGQKELSSRAIWCANAATVFRSCMATKNGRLVLASRARAGASAFQLKSGFRNHRSRASYAARQALVSGCRKRRQAGAARIGFGRRGRASDDQRLTDTIRFGLTATKKSAMPWRAIGPAVGCGCWHKKFYSLEGKPGFDYVMIGRAATPRRMGKN